jgi:hypothetical protein
MTDHTTEAEAVADMTRKADATVPGQLVETQDGRIFAIHRNDFAFKDITPPHKAQAIKPKLVEQSVKVQTVHSLINYTQRFKNADSVIFADMARNRVLTIIDYHQQSGVAELAKHSVSLDLPHSLEWKTWTGASDNLVTHKDFATFLEHNQIDILPLPQLKAETEEEGDLPQTLLEMIRQLQVVNNSKFESSVRHGDYDIVDYHKEADATVKGKVALPVMFQIRIPVYFGESPVTLTCFIRKKIVDETLRIGFSLLRAENVRQEEFQRIVAEIEATTDLTTLFGTPS